MVMHGLGELERTNGTEERTNKARTATQKSRLAVHNVVMLYFFSPSLLFVQNFPSPTHAVLIPN